VKKVATWLSTFEDLTVTVDGEILKCYQGFIISGIETASTYPWSYIIHMKGLILKTDHASLQRKNAHILLCHLLSSNE